MTITDTYARHGLDVPNEALADELRALRAERAALIAYLRAQRHEGAPVVRIEQLLAMLGGLR